MPEGKDIVTLVDKDETFVGVVSRLDPQMVDPGYVSQAINRKFEAKLVSNRWGIVQPKWGGKWNSTSQSFTVYKNDTLWNRSSPGTPIPINTVVCSDVDTNTLIVQNGARVVSDDNTNCILNTKTYSWAGANPGTYKLKYYSSTTAFTDILGMLQYRDPQNGNSGLIVATNEARSSDGGQGKVYLVRPNSSHIEIPLNGWDIYGPVRLIQCDNAIAMLRPFADRYYFNGGAVNASTDKITLNVKPDLMTGDRVVVGQVGTAPALWSAASLSSGQGFGLWVNVNGTSVSLYTSESTARIGGSTGLVDLNSVSSSYRYYIQKQKNVTGNTIVEPELDFQNDAYPILMQSDGTSKLAITAGFNRTPNSLTISSADSSAKTITVYNHGFVPGDKVTISSATNSSFNNDYYVYPVDANTLKLFRGTTADTDSLINATPAAAFATASGPGPTYPATSTTVVSNGYGYTSAPTVTSGTYIPGASFTGVLGTGTQNSSLASVTIVASGAAYVAGNYGLTVSLPSTLVDIPGSFTGNITKFGASGMPIPAGREGCYFQNRLLMVYGFDMLAVSDVLDPLHYSPVINEFKLNAGSNDKVVAIYPFNQTTLLIFKTNSILAIENLYGDLSSVRLSEVTREFGCIAPLSIAGTGSDVVFLTQRGVASLKQTEYGISQSVVVPISNPIQPEIDDIDKRSSVYAVGTYFDNRYLLSVPVNGGDGTNQRTLVFNFLNQAWEGYWEGSLLLPRYFSRVSLYGSDYLAWADESGFVHYFDKQAWADRKIDGTEYQISTRIEFRGYTFGTPIHKQYTGIEIQLDYNNPRYSFWCDLDGVNEVMTLATNQTQPRANYFTYGTADYDITNANDDFLTPYRKDYSWTPGLKCGNNGVKVNQRQVILAKYRLRRHGNTIQPVLTSDQGYVEVSSIQLYAIPFRLFGRTDI